MLGFEGADKAAFAIVDKYATVMRAVLQVKFMIVAL